MYIHDQHVHSKYSMDSNEELENYYKIAASSGCKYFVTTEHYDLDLVEHNSEWTIDFSKLNKELALLQKKYQGLTSLLGIEIGYQKKVLNRINEVLNSEHFDLINLSIHSNDYVDFYWPKYYEKYGINEVMNSYFDQMIEATANFQNYDVLSHIDYAFKTIYLMDKTKSTKLSDYENKVKQVLKNVINNDKTLELNTKVQHSIGDVEHTKYLLNLYKSLGGINLTISSDAHSAERYLDDMSYYQKIAKECGFDHLVYFVNRKKYNYSIE